MGTNIPKIRKDFKKLLKLCLIDTIILSTNRRLNLGLGKLLEL